VYKMRRRKAKENEIISISIISSALIYTFAFLFTSKMGILGEIIVKNALSYLGLGAYILPFLLLFWSFILFFNYKLNSPVFKSIGIIFLLIILLTFIHLKILLLDNAYELTKNGAGGGLLGYHLANFLYLYFGIQGSYLVLISLSLIVALIVTDISYFNLFHNFSSNIKKFCSYIINYIINIPDRTTRKFSPKKDLDFNKIKMYRREELLSQNDKDKRISKLPEEQRTFAKEETNEIPSSTALTQYQMPSLSLLTSSEIKDRGDVELDIEKNIKILEKTFYNFGIDAKVVGVIQGPTVTRYEIQPAPGVKIAKITNLSNDIALAFAVASVRIEAPIPGKNAVGIEVPNQKRITVYLKEILQSNEFMEGKHKLPIALGIDIGGKPIITDLTELPHLLIAGATGSGKSVCINNIILSFIYKLHPDSVKFIMIDPKRVELNIYNGIPHLLLPIITESKQSVKVLNWTIAEMEKRFKIFAEAGVRNLEGYNEYIRNVKADASTLPYIVLIIDELADLMLSAPVKVEELLCRLAQMTRATGIHLIIATQRPSVDIITGSIKVNFPSRIAFAVSSQVDSRTILDINGAEKLLGNGDMLFSPVGTSKPIRAQGAFVKEKDIKNIISFLKKHNTDHTYQQELLEIKRDQDTHIESEEEDELFNEAVSIIIHSKQASISILQRKLRIGYTRAARLIDLMEDRGIVGPYDGRNPRKILVSEKEFE